MGSYNVDVVCFHDEAGVYALYVNGELVEYGDYYHNKIQDLIKGYLLGWTHAGIEYSRQDWTLSDKQQEVFADDYGYEAPERFPEKGFVFLKCDGG